MVSKKAGRSKAIKRRRIIISIVLLVSFVCGFIIVGMIYLFSAHELTDRDNDVVASETERIEPEAVTLPAKINFQPTIDQWVKSIGGNKSVLIYDLERDEVVGEYAADVKYNTASLYKLFVVYEGYRRIQSGEWQPEDLAGTTGFSVLECLDLAIRESHSVCAEVLWGKIGQANLDKIVKKDFDIQDSDVSELVSNPRDIMKMMKIFYEHKEIRDPELTSRMKDSFLNQPTTTYNWRQGLPSGFADKVNVYNKVGWDYNPDEGYWNIYHDAAVVEFPERDRHFIVVVMTNRVPYQKIRDLGKMIEEDFNKY